MTYQLVLLGGIILGMIILVFAGKQLKAWADQNIPGYKEASDQASSILTEGIKLRLIERKLRRMK